jgi:hypothetical protein
MTDLCTITGDLLIPPALMQRYAMPDLEHHLQAAGLLPATAEQRRWRMDFETPGHYRLTFSVTLPLDTEEG